MSKKTSRWESFLLIALIAGIVIGFAWTMFHALYRPKPADGTADPKEEAARLRKVRENPRFYHTSMNVHPFADDPRNRPSRPSGETTDEMIPAIPEAEMSAPNPIDTMSNFRPTRPMRPVDRADDPMADEEEESGNKSGWGWLADDIAANRGPVKAEGKPTDQKVVEEDDDPEKRERDAARKSDENRREERQQEDRAYFKDDAYGSGAEKRKDPYMRPVLADRDESRERTEELDEYGESRADAERDRRDTTLDEKRDPLEMRDPFASGRESSTLFGSRESGFGGEDSMRGVGWSEGEIRREASFGFQDDQSARVMRDAESSARVSAYSSDAVFNNGAGYTPQGVSAYGADSAFSGSGAFGGAGGFGSTPGAAADGGASSLAPLSTPTIQSFDAQRNAQEAISTPRALPW